MQVSLIRNVWTVPAAQTLIDVSTDADLTPAFRVETASFGVVHFPAAMTSTAITFTVCDTEDGTFVTLIDDTGADITYTIAASKAIALPPELFGSRYAKIATGSGEAADRQLIVTLKG